MKKELSWEEIKAIKVGTILHNELDDGVRFIIMRGPSSLCAYVGVPISHPLAGQEYDSLPISCHGGLTFSRKGEQQWPEGFWWYGWDYSHCDDYLFYYDDGSYSDNLRKGRKWLIEDVKDDSFYAIYDTKKLMKLAESTAKKYMGWIK